MRFDIKGRHAPTSVVLYPRGVRKVFPMPYDTEDPAEIKMLSDFPLTEAVKERQFHAPPPAPEAPTEEPKTPKPSRKEV